MGISRVLWAFFLRDLRTARSYRMAWVMDFFGGFFELALFYFLSRMIMDPGLGPSSDAAVSYFDFVIVGLALYNFLMIGIAIFSTSLRAEQTTGTLEVLLSMPTSPTLTMFGVAAYGFARALLMTSIMLAVAASLFGLRIVLDPVALLAAFCALIASAALFMSLGILVAGATLIFKRAGSLVGMAVQGLGLFSGVYFPLDVMPRPLQLIGEGIPMTWALDVLRQALLVGEIALVRVLFLVLASVIALPISLWLFYQATQRARREGSLGQY